MWRCSKPDAKMTFFIIYSICQLFHKPTHLYNQVGQNLFGIMLIKNISQCYVLCHCIYTIETESILLLISPTFLQGIRAWLYSQKLNVSCVLSIPVGAPLNQAPGYHQSLPAASYKHLFILHRPQCHLPFPFASLYILLVFYPSL